MSNANEPAYPAVKLTKREYAAIAAMQGLLSGGEFACADERQARSVAYYAVQQADALLAELEEKG